MTTTKQQPFVSRGGAAWRGILALRDGPLNTPALAERMGVHPRRCHAYMRWALDAGAVEIIKPGESGRVNRPSLWAIGATPAVLWTEGRRCQKRRRSRVHCRPDLRGASVFAWAA